MTAAVSLLIVGGSVSSFAAPIGKGPGAHCSLKTLTGSYIYSAQGSLEGQPYASSGIFSFNGAGGIALLYTRSVEKEQHSTKGTYTVNGNCSGSMKLETGTANDFYLSPNGDSFNFVRMSGESAVGGEARRVSRALIVQQP